MDYNNEMPHGKTDDLGMPEQLDRQPKARRFSLWKLLLFIFIIIYFIFTAYRVPLLIKLGEYLIVEHTAEKADVIVCLAGGSQNIDRALATVDAYKKGLAPYIIRAKEIEPDGLDHLRKKVKNYPTSFDLFKQVTGGFGIPEKAILSTDEGASSTMDEALKVRRIVLNKGFKSLVIVTSLTHSRRAWLTFKKVFKDDNVKILSLPSHYQKFDPKNWWTKRKYIKELIIEYQKLIYYRITYLM